MSPDATGTFPPKFEIPEKARADAKEQGVDLDAVDVDAEPDWVIVNPEYVPNPEPPPYPHAPARHTDPVESKEAGKGVKVTNDQYFTLRVFALLTTPDGPGVTFRECGVKAAELDGLPDDFSREESLRRRGSDLREKGWIEHVGRDGRKSLNRITQAGLDVLRGVGGNQ